MIMEKKAYIAPQMEFVDIEPTTIIATSNPGGPNIGIVGGEENGGEEILSNDRRGDWGNLWNKD